MAALAQNKKASFNFEILEKFIAGISLKGWQVKSIKAGSTSLGEAFVYFHRGEAFMKGIHISPWKTMPVTEKENKAQLVKLLLHKKEIEKLTGKLAQKGLALIPLRLFEERGLIKVELGLARGKHIYDKRSKIKEREQKREIARDIKDSKYF